MLSFSDLRTAAYCPRQCYYRRQEDDRSPPDAVRARRRVAFRYPELRTADDDVLRKEPIAVAPGEYRRNLCRLRESALWGDLTDPVARDVLLTGRECRGVVHKLLDDPPRPVVLSAGDPPPEGVWEPQSVHAVAAAKALAWDRETPVEAAVVEYPAHGVVRELSLTTRRKAAYRRAVRTVRTLDGPPPRLHDDAKCGACEYADRCGVQSRTFASLLGW